MVITVYCFARARELLGDTVTIEVEEPATVADLLQRLQQRFPMSREFLARSALAVNRQIASGRDPVPGDAEVALIPPVSGG